MSRGKFVVISGPDGAGKTTLINKICRLYSPFRVMRVREPGGTPLSEAIRSELLGDVGKDWSPVTQLLHFFCARANLLACEISGALDQGVNVLADRFDESTFAYQVVGFENREIEPLFWEIRQRLLVDQGLAPDLYIFLSVPVEVGVSRRMRDRGTEANHLDKRFKDFHKRVAGGLVGFFSKVPHTTLDGVQSPDGVLVDCLKILEPLFGKPNKKPGT